MHTGRQDRVFFRDLQEGGTLTAIPIARVHIRGASTTCAAINFEGREFFYKNFVYRLEI